MIDRHAMKLVVSKLVESGEPPVVELGEAKADKPETDSPWWPYDAYPAYSWGCCVAEVVVDLLTGEIRTASVHQISEIGRVVHPLLALGQVRGGVAQGIGWALSESVVRNEEGGMANANLADYAIPGMLDVPRIENRFLEFPGRNASLNAKGLGEFPMEGPAPAIANAVALAIGNRPGRLPITAESLLSWIELSDP